jgi:large subunit ribosomal protein L2
MPVRKYKPTTPGRRRSTVDTFSDITKTKPEKQLVVGLRKKGGRNHRGTITTRHRGGGVKRRARMVDFHRMRFDEPAKVIAIEYDPNRNARLALIEYADSTRAYIIAPHELVVGREVVASLTKGEIAIGNRFPLGQIPTGLTVHGIELEPGRGAQLARAGGTGVVLVAVEGKYAQLKLPSGEIRLVPHTCMATIGQVSNPDAWLVRLGKAGRKRHKGFRPTVRGKAMNPVDHPHGGGEARNPIGLKYPKTPWGKHALGVKTRRKHKASDALILKRRKRKKR